MIPNQQTIRLSANTGVHEAASLKQHLLSLVQCADEVIIDVTDIELIDTAALQLLFAFDRERIGTGLRTTWQGDSQIFRNSATALGLQMGDSAAVTTSSVCEHDA